MSSANSFGRFLGTINGQPIIIKDDLSLNAIQGFGSDILQQAIDDVPSTDTITSNASCINNIVLNSGHNVSVLNDSTGRNEYIAVLSNDPNSEETNAIRLTLEQAAQLGLHFDMDTTEQSLHKEMTITSPNASQFMNNKTGQIQSSDESCLKLNSEITCNLTEDVNMLDKSSENSPFLDNFRTETSHNQQLTLVPHIINGTVTYTLQLTDETLSNLSNNELFRINESSVITETSNSVENGLKIDMGNLSGSSEIPFINSPVDIITNKGLVGPNEEINEDNNSSQTYGLVSCSSENVTFLNLADAIPVGTSISNIVSHINNVSVQRITQQPKLASAIRKPNELLKHKLYANQGGESLLKHRSLSPYQNGINNPVKNKCKMGEKNSFNDQLMSLPLQSVTNDNSNNSSDICVDQNDRNGCLKSEDHQAHEEIDEVDMSLCKGELSNFDNGKSNIKQSGNSTDLRQTPTIITPSAGDLPREVSVALSRIPIKTDSNKPLGSNENPIQLVQQGSTFHSMQALTDDHISKIKPILQGNFDPKMPSKNVVYDPASNTRIIYRVISPAEVSLRKKDEFPRRRGRPKKARSIDSQAEDAGDGVPQPKKAFPRTRSGRLSRPPKHMVRDYKHLRRAEIDDSDGAYSDYQSEHEEDPSVPPESAPVELLPGLVAKRKSHKRNISAGNLCPTCGKIYLGYVRMKRHFDKYPDHGSIEYLNTIRNSNSNPDSEAENHRLDAGNGLWKKGGKKKGKGRHHYFSSVDKRTRLKEALGWCSEQEVAEVAGPAVASVLSLWQLLLLRVDTLKADSRVAALYAEVCQLVQKLRSVAHQLFRPLDHPTPPATKHTTVQVEDDIMTGILNLPHGVYLASDEDLVEAPARTVQKTPDITPEPEVSQEKKPSLLSDENLKVKTNIDEVPQSFLLTSEEMICDTDDRVLVNVDEIVSERLQNFTGSQSSSVDELMKGLNELEQRNKLETDDLMDGFSIVSRRTHVSASTEDLMKSLEHFESDLNHTDAPNTMDRETFDRVTNVDTLDFEVLSREFHSNNR